MGLPWGPCTAAQGAPLTAGAGLGLGSVLRGGLSSVSSLAAESPEQGSVSAGASSMGSRHGLPRGKPLLPLPSGL